MGSVLNVYRRDGGYMFRSSEAMIASFERFTNHDCYYFDAARESVPRHIRTLHPDLVVIHHNVLTCRFEPEYSRLLAMLSFIADLPCKKVAVTSDESWHVDRMVDMIRRLGATEIFSFAPESEFPKIYEGLEEASVRIHPVMSAYVDDKMVKRVARLSRKNPDRPIDVGLRIGGGWFLGSQGQMRTRIGEVLGPLAEAAGLRVDISSQKLGVGDPWLEFLLKCRYQLGVETGSSVLDRTGSLCEAMCNLAQSGRTADEVWAEHSHLDGNLDYRALAPRHLEAVITRTCQVLLEGDYSGVLKPNAHYIPVTKDFSNASEVIERLSDERARVEMVERAFQDIVASGRFTYAEFANTILASSLEPSTTARRSLVLRLVNRADEALSRPWRVYVDGALQVRRDAVKRALRPAFSQLIGEARLRRVLARIRGRQAPASTKDS